MGASVGTLTQPIHCDASHRAYTDGNTAATLAGAYGNTGVQLADTACRWGVLVQCITVSGKYIYIKMDTDKTVPGDATDYSVRLANGDSMVLPVSNLNQLFAWTDDTTTATQLNITVFK